MHYKTKVQNCTIGGETIRGVLYIPDGAKRALVIGSHGFGSTHERLEPYAEALASAGCATYIYDFRGGGEQSASDGTTVNMSVMTETSDLEAVLAASRAWTDIASQRTILLGASQGGFVSAVAAARHPAEVSALILLYPAFVLIDDMHKAFASLDDVPHDLMYRNLHLGRRYFSDVWNYDPYAEIGAYRGPVLIVHGTADPVVPLQYSERARSVYPNAKLDVIEGGGHGFEGETLSRSIEDILRFLQNLGV